MRESHAEKEAFLTITADNSLVECSSLTKNQLNCEKKNIFLNLHILAVCILFLAKKVFFYIFVVIDVIKMMTQDTMKIV